MPCWRSPTRPTARRWCARCTATTWWWCPTSCPGSCSPACAPSASRPGGTRPPRAWRCSTTACSPSLTTPASPTRTTSTSSAGPWPASSRPVAPRPARGGTTGASGRRGRGAGPADRRGAGPGAARARSRAPAGRPRRPRCGDGPPRRRPSIRSPTSPARLTSRRLLPTAPSRPRPRSRPPRPRHRPLTASRIGTRTAVPPQRTSMPVRSAPATPAPSDRAPGRPAARSSAGAGDAGALAAAAGRGVAVVLEGEAGAVALLRRDISAAAGHPMILRLRGGDAAARFAARHDLATVSQVGPATPDHVLRTKRVPLLGRDWRATCATTAPTSSATAPGWAAGRWCPSTRRHGWSSTPSWECWVPGAGRPTRPPRSRSTTTPCGSSTGPWPWAATPCSRPTSSTSSTGSSSRPS